MLIRQTWSSHLLLLTWVEVVVVVADKERSEVTGFVELKLISGDWSRFCFVELELPEYSIGTVNW